MKIWIGNQQIKKTVTKVRSILTTYWGQSSLLNHFISKLYQINVIITINCQIVNFLSFLFYLLSFFYSNELKNFETDIHFLLEIFLQSFGLINFSKIVNSLVLSITLEYSKCFIYRKIRQIIFGSKLSY